MGADITSKAEKMAAGNQSGAFAAVWEVVRQWPATEQHALASQILASLSAEQPPASAKAHPATLIGAWRDARALDDAAAQTLLEEELLRKHG